jgi:hypothetical protein
VIWVAPHPKLVLLRGCSGTGSSGTDISHCCNIRSERHCFLPVFSKFQVEHMSDSQ